MKRLILITAFLLPYLMYGQVAVDKSVHAVNYDEPYFAPVVNITPVAAEKINESEIQGYTRVNLQLPDAYWSWYASSAPTPFVYEPKSGALVFGGHDRMQNGSLYIVTSSNNGKNWSSKKTIFSEADNFPVLPTIGVLNPKNSANISDFKYLISSQKFDDNTNVKAFVGAEIIFYGTGINDAALYQGPLDNSNYRWSATQTASIDNGEPGYIFNAGMLGNNPGAQYGAYGFFSVYHDVDDYDFITSTLPSYWETSNFRLPDNTPGDPTQYTLNNPMLISVDKSDNVYAAVNNFFTEETEVRLPGVSKSKDLGVSWEDWEMMPRLVLEDYIQSQGGQVGWQNFWTGPTAYQQDAFVATGNDEYSYILRLWMTSDAQNWDIFQIVEAYSKNNVWNIRKVADMQGLPYYGGVPTVFLIDDGANFTNNTINDSLSQSRLGNEVQVSITKDGQQLLVKWVESVDRFIILDPPFQNKMSGGTALVDSIYATDVFTSWKDVDGKTWSNPINVTNDTIYNKMTYIPSVIPSLEDVPMVSMYTVRATQGLLTNRNTYAPYALQLVVDQNQPQDLMFTRFNAITGGDPISVPEPVHYSTDVILKDAYYNSKTNMAELGFKLGKPTMVRFELYNSLGQLVKVLAEGMSDPGTNAVNVNTSKLNAGVYYYTLIANGQRQTKVLAIN